MANLRRGMSGPKVKALQEALLSLGFKLPRYGADGQFGEETEAAVRAFQKLYGLKVDGIVGHETSGMLNSLLTYQAIEQGQTYSPVDYSSTNGQGGEAIPVIRESSGIEAPAWVKEWVKEYNPEVEPVEAPEWVKEWVKGYTPAQLSVPARKKLMIAGYEIDWRWLGLGMIAFLVYIGHKEKYF